MAFLNRDQEEDDELPGSSGLHLDLELRVCPECRREALPWQESCPECGVEPVPRAQLPSSQSFQLPAHLLDDEPDGPVPDPGRDPGTES